MKQFLILIITSLIIISCNSSEQIISNLNNSNQINYIPSYQHSYNSIWNSNNPYDSLGFKHNLLMDYLSDNSSQIDSNNVSLSIKQIIRTLYMDFAYSSAEYDSTLIFYENTNIINAINTNYNDTITRNRLEQILNTLHNLSDLNQCDLIIDTIKSIETSISTLPISIIDKNRLYIICSIAKFSVKYWYEVLTDSNHPFYNVGKNIHVVEIPKIMLPISLSQKGANILLGDAVGATIGALVGGGVTSPGSMLAGAAIGSATMAVSVFWDDISSFASKTWDFLTNWW